ncbi:hypothetical protein CB1_000261034 [Camelus ferus]|nr:hypothetical protein CB1_000261034 [Camelus ferus]
MASSRCQQDPGSAGNVNLRSEQPGWKACPPKSLCLPYIGRGWAHVVCALYIPEVQFANVLTMEPIVLQYVPHDRFNKTCYICEEQGRESKAASGACMTCNRHGCRQAFHVTWWTFLVSAQMAGLLCEEEVLEVDNVKYCGYCKYHFSKMSRKDKERLKQKHKKRPESPSSILTPPVVPTADKVGGTESAAHGGLQGRPLDSTLKAPLIPSTHKRMPTLSAAPVPAEETPETGLKEKKHKASKRSRHGPGRPKGSRNKEVTGGPALPSLPGAQLAGFTATAASPFSGGSLVSSGLGGLASRTFGPSGSLPSLSLESPLLGAGIYTSNKDPISHGGGMLRAVCSTPLSSSLLGPPGTSALPRLSRSPFTSTLPSSSASISTTQVFSLAGSTFSLPSTHIFGTPMGAVNPLLTQAESSHTGMSPISSLPALFDQTASAPCGGGQLDPAAPGTTNMEQLLEKQGDGEAGVNTGSSDSLSTSKSPPGKNSLGLDNSLSTSSEEHQTVVYQMIQQIQQKRELQRLQMAGGSQLPMASLLAGSSTPLLSAGTPGLLPTASAPPLLPAGALVAPSLGNNTSLMAAAAAAAAVAAAGGPPVLTAQTNPFLSLAGADGGGPKGGARWFPKAPAKPVVALKTPIKVELVAGKTYRWCVCGRSKKQPFCDGSHFFQRTGLSPLKFKAQETRMVVLCTCKATQKPPFCDGTHKSERVQKAEVGSPL